MALTRLIRLMLPPRSRAIRIDLAYWAILGSAPSTRSPRPRSTRLPPLGENRHGMPAQPELASVDWVNPPAGYELVDPDAAALIELLRAFGYSPQAALADLIDNSITAGAREIWVDLEWDGSKSFATILDNGSGMSAEALTNAMRAGSQSPLQARVPADLGRFGLGLKTASFSQCRRLTVRSKTVSGSDAVRAWDLDYVSATREWRLLRGPAPGSELHLQPIDGFDGGTLVLWEVMDRLVGEAATEDQRAHRRFLTVVDEVAAHLSMVFHRFLTSSLKIFLNGQQLQPWDPFLANNPATQPLGEEKLWLQGAEITARPFVLPHVSHLDNATHQTAGGPRGWNAQQGFYVYRAGRLLVAGDWLGLGFQKEPHMSLARIQLDIPNSTDQDWDIDVRKSRARPPGVLRDDLVRIAKVTRQRAAEVYRYRGKAIARSASQEHVFAWARRVNRGRISYRINRAHPLVVESLSHETSAETLEALLRLLEETIPVPLIVVDSAEQPEQQASPFEEASAGAVQAVLDQAYLALRHRGESHDTAVAHLLAMEPFDRFADLVVALGESQPGSKVS